MRQASGAARYEDRWALASRGISIGSLPLGTTRPDSTPAIAALPSWPGKNAWTTAASRPAAGPIA